MLHSFERAAELFTGGVLDPDIRIIHRFPLADYPKALDQFTNGVGRKIHSMPRG